VRHGCRPAALLARWAYLLGLGLGIGEVGGLGVGEIGGLGQAAEGSTGSRAGLPGPGRLGSWSGYIADLIGTSSMSRSSAWSTRLSASTLRRRRPWRKLHRWLAWMWVFAASSFVVIVPCWMRRSKSSRARSCVCLRVIGPLECSAIAMSDDRRREVSELHAAALPGSERCGFKGYFALLLRDVPLDTCAA
jgi:hypothetical protein